MVRFANLLDESCAAVDVKAADKRAALVAVVKLLAGAHEGLDESRLLAEILAREALSSTGLGEGMAIPHAMCDVITETSLAVARLEKPVDFGSLDGAPVDLVFMLAGPKGDQAAHLQVLSKMARLLNDEAFRQSLRAAPDGPSLAGILYGKD